MPVKPYVFRYDNVRNFFLGSRRIDSNIGTAGISFDLQIAEGSYADSLWIKRGAGQVTTNATYSGTTRTFEEFSSVGLTEPVTLPILGTGTGALAIVGECIDGSMGTTGQVNQFRGLEASLAFHGAALGRVIYFAEDLAAPGDGGEHDLGAVPDGMALYICFHVADVQGGDITLMVEADAPGFAGPVAVGSYGPIVAPGSHHVLYRDPIATTHYRATVAGTFTSATFSVSAGIDF